MNNETVAKILVGMLLISAITLLVSLTNEEKKLIPARKHCEVVCLPKAVSYTLADGKCVCDLTKEVK